VELYLIVVSIQFVIYPLIPWSNPNIEPPVFIEKFLIKNGSTFWLAYDPIVIVSPVKERPDSV